jgi:hypothetical protein
VPFGPGLWPGPRRQARWAGRGLRRSRVGPDDRFCDAVRNDHRVPLTLEGPARTMRGAPALWLSPFIRRLAHLARDDRPGPLAERVTHGALRRGAGCGRVRGVGAAGSGPRRCAIAQEEVGQAAPPPAARVPTNRLAATAQHSPRAFTLCVLVPRIIRESRPGPAGLARRRCALETVEKVVTSQRAACCLPVFGLPLASIRPLLLILRPHLRCCGQLHRRGLVPGRHFLREQSNRLTRHRRDDCERILPHA